MDLTSTRLVYSKFTEADLGDYLLWYTNDRVMKYISGRGLTEMEAKTRFKNALKTNAKDPDMGLYSVKDKENNSFIGIAKLVMLNETQAEVGYGSLPQFWNLHYATEMLDCLMAYAAGIPRVKELIAVVNPANAISKRVLENRSFRRYESGTEGDMPVEYYRVMV
jgi:ribosomal-protein-alanine N-acetyltransferase